MFRPAAIEAEAVGARAPRPERDFTGITIREPGRATPSPGRPAERGEPFQRPQVPAESVTAPVLAVENFVPLLPGFAAKDLSPVAAQVLEAQGRPAEKLTKKRSSEIIVDFLNQAAVRSPAFADEVKPREAEYGGRVVGTGRVVPGGISLSRLQSPEFITRVAADLRAPAEEPITVRPAEPMPGRPIPALPSEPIKGVPRVVYRGHGRTDQGEAYSVITDFSL